MKKEISVKELVESLSERYCILGSWDRYISRALPIDEADEESLAFATKARGLQAIRESNAGIVVCSNELDYSEIDYESKTLIQVANPRLTFTRLLRDFFVDRIEPGIHPSSIIDARAKIDPHVYIGPHCYIGECEIGEGTIIYGSVHIYPKTRIGKRVIIHAGTVIGSDGFGFERNEKGELGKFPQIGGVVIEDDVEIQSNCSIARGALVNTTIGEGTKLDNLVHIAHNVKIGKHCFIAAGTIFGGSTTVGDYTLIGLNVTIRDWISVGNNVFIGMGSVVTKSVDDNLVIAGVPARELRKNI